MANITDSFIAYLMERGNGDIPEKVYEKAEACFIDYLGVVYTGAQECGETVAGLADGNLGSSSVLGSEKKTNAGYAAFINGFHAHALELDDGHRFGMIHLGAVIISAVLAAVQEKTVPYKQFLKGIIMGYEAAVRLAIAMQPGHKKKGFHTTGTCGTVGAAVGIAFAMKYGESQLKTAIAAATTGAAGLLEIQEDASTLKPYNVAHAAMAGVVAAYAGRSGLLHGPDDILGGNRGMLYLMSDTVSVNRLTEIENYYEIERIYVKPYAACRHCHPAMEAAIDLSNEYAIPFDNIRNIKVYTYSLAIKGHDHTEIKGIGSAKLSMPYSVAAAYILKSGNLEAFSTENIARQDILELTARVDVLERQEFSEQASQKRIAEVELYAKDGSVVKKRVDYAKGDPENPMSRQEVLDKFRKLMSLYRETHKADSILDILGRNEIDTQELFEML